MCIYRYVYYSQCQHQEFSLHTPCGAATIRRLSQRDRLTSSSDLSEQSGTQRAGPSHGTESTRRSSFTYGQLDQSELRSHTSTTERRHSTGDFSTQSVRKSLSMANLFSGLGLRWSNPAAPICRSVHGDALMEKLTPEDLSSSSTAVDTDGMSKSSTNVHDDLSSCTGESLSRTTTTSVNTLELTTLTGKCSDSEATSTMGDQGLATLHITDVSVTVSVHPAGADNVTAMVSSELDVECVGGSPPLAGPVSRSDVPVSSTAVARTHTTSATTISGRTSLSSATAGPKSASTAKDRGIKKGAAEDTHSSISPRKSLPSPWRLGSTKATSGGPASPGSTAPQSKTIGRTRMSCVPSSDTADQPSAVRGTKTKATEKDGTPERTLRIRSSAPNLRTAQRAAVREFRSKDSPTDPQSPTVRTLRGEGAPAEPAHASWLSLTASPKPEKSTDVSRLPERSMTTQSKVKGSAKTTLRMDVPESSTSRHSPRSAKPKLAVVIPNLQSSSTGIKLISPTSSSATESESGLASATTDSSSRIPKMALKMRRSAAPSSGSPEKSTVATRWLREYQDSIPTSSVLVEFSPKPQNIMSQELSSLSEPDEDKGESSEKSAVAAVDILSNESPIATGKGAEAPVELGSDGVSSVLAPESSCSSAPGSDPQPVDAATDDKTCESGDVTSSSGKETSDACSTEVERLRAPSARVGLEDSTDPSHNGSVFEAKSELAIANEPLPSDQRDTATSLVATLALHTSGEETQLAEPPELDTDLTRTNANEESDVTCRDVSRGTTTTAAATECDSQKDNSPESKLQLLNDPAIIYSTRKIDDLSPTSLDSAIIDCGPRTRTDSLVTCDSSGGCSGAKDADTAMSPVPSILDNRTASIWQQTSPTRDRAPASLSDIALQELPDLSRTRSSELRATAPCFLPRARVALPASWTDQGSVGTTSDAADQVLSPSSTHSSDMWFSSQPSKKGGKKKNKNRNKNRKFGTLYSGSYNYYDPAASTACYPGYHPMNWTAPADTPQLSYFGKSRNRRFDDSFIAIFDDRNAPTNRMPSFYRKPYNNAINHARAGGQPHFPCHQPTYENDQDNVPHVSNSIEKGGYAGYAEKVASLVSEGTENVHPAADVVDADGKISKSAIEVVPCGVYEVELASEHIGGLCHDCWPRK